MDTNYLRYINAMLCFKDGGICSSHVLSPFTVKAVIMFYQIFRHLVCLIYGK